MPSDTNILLRAVSDNINSVIDIINSSTNFTLIILISQLVFVLNKTEIL